ncbi:alpha/beta-hydrolase [Neolentinus lepideus HHB14362 ss-1]|uniref:Alpha/beta-hydrolase n=1 Tax=Neolentinus lepideus HHB14362 ss-1 TaxID=1314782 RepID=A0A165NSD7_9AGAM|nr:alpha/beta-hydrolase [Neolentinus lepideus HHB14362 ss-1]
MDYVNKTSEVSIPLIHETTIEAFLPLLEKNREYIEEIPRKTFQYGPTERHQLDVYYPISTAAKAPILFFVYGGGFSMGNRIFPEPQSLGYPCLGAFFARRGFVTVIADYRLVPHIKYPKPVEDLRDAFQWIFEDKPEIHLAGHPAPDVENAFIMAHSAGATHIATLLLSQTILSPSVRPGFLSRIKKVVLNAGAYHFRSEHAADPSVLEAYYGNTTELRDKEPLSLAEKASLDLIKSLPDTLMMRGEKEPRGLIVPNEEFRSELEKRLKDAGGGRNGQTEVRLIVNKGHNHISGHWALSSGEGEEWTEEVLTFLRG